MTETEGGETNVTVEGVATERGEGIEIDAVIEIGTEIEVATERGTETEEGTETPTETRSGSEVGVPKKTAIKSYGDGKQKE